MKRADSKHNYKVPPSGYFYKVSLHTLKCYEIIFRNATLGSQKVQASSYKVNMPQGCNVQHCDYK